MLTTIEAEIDVSGEVTFLEPLKISKKVGQLLFYSMTRNLKEVR